MCKGVVAAIVYTYSQCGCVFIIKLRTGCSQFSRSLPPPYTRFNQWNIGQTLTRVILRYKVINFTFVWAFKSSCPAISNYWMAKPKSKKTVTRKASLASLLDIRTAHDAADNPPVPLLLSDVTGQRRSKYKHTATSENFSQGDKAVCESDQLEDADGKSNSHHRKSLLTPIWGSDE